MQEVIFLTVTSFCISFTSPDWKHSDYGLPSKSFCIHQEDLSSVVSLSQWSCCQGPNPSEKMRWAGGFLVHPQTGNYRKCFIRYPQKARHFCWESLEMQMFNADRQNHVAGLQHIWMCEMGITCPIWWKSTSQPAWNHIIFTRFLS